MSRTFTEKQLEIISTVVDYVAYREVRIAYTMPSTLEPTIVADIISAKVKEILRGDGAEDESSKK